MSAISLSTHVLDTALGLPAAGVPVLLEHRDGAGAWARISVHETDDDGRVGELVPDGDPLPGGVYRVTFDLLATEATAGGWYPEVSIVVHLAADSGHSHVPLLLAPYGFSTYRGS